MTACFKLMKALQPKEHHSAPASFCDPCVYYSENIDPAYRKADGPACCGLGFAPKDAGCSEMRTNNCSARKR